MTRFFKSKTFAWCAFALVIALIIFTYPNRMAWWMFIDIFFAFMAAFINVVAISVKKINPIVSKMLYKWVAIFCILYLIAFVAEWIAFYVIF